MVKVVGSEVRRMNSDNQQPEHYRQWSNAVVGLRRSILKSQRKNATSLVYSRERDCQITNWNEDWNQSRTRDDIASDIVLWVVVLREIVSLALVFDFASFALHNGQWEGVAKVCDAMISSTNTRRLSDYQELSCLHWRWNDRKRDSVF
jgi:hypothetical protein